MDKHEYQPHNGLWSLVSGLWLSLCFAITSFVDHLHHASFKDYLRENLPSPLKKVLVRLRAKVVIPIRLLLHRPPLTKKTRITFEVHLAEHCNLNCAGCTHFAPLAEKEFPKLETFRRDFIRMGELFSHKCGFINLMGGEPLLNPDVNEYMRIARENFTEGKISLLTNGILLMNMNDDFWKACHDNNIVLAITHYPIKLDTQGIKQKARRFEVTLEWLGSSASKAKTFFGKHAIDFTASQDMLKSFAYCGNGNSCRLLRDGKLYPCSFAGNVCHFNKKFGDKIKITDADYVDIYKTDADTILQKGIEPVPLCRYCNLKASTKFPWHISQSNEIGDWS